MKERLDNQPADKPEGGRFYRYCCRFVGRGPERLGYSMAHLPEPLQRYIHQATRYGILGWRQEYSLTAHLIREFEGKLQAGMNAQEIIREMPTPRRQAWRHVRSQGMLLFSWLVVSHLFRVFTATFLAVYLLACVVLYWEKPQVKVDYFALINARALAADPAQTAWPGYMQIIQDLSAVPDKPWDRPSRTDSEPGMQVDVATFAPFKAYAARIRELTKKPELGLVLKPVWLLNDDELRMFYSDRLLSYMQIPRPFVADNHPACKVQESAFKDFDTAPTYAINQFRMILVTDLRAAVYEKDSQRVWDNFQALLNLSRQIAQPQTRWCTLLAYNCHAAAVQALGDAVVTDWQILNINQLRQARLLIARYALEISGQPRFQYAELLDQLQRFYTDNGNADGRPSYIGLIGTIRSKLSLTGQHITEPPAWGSRIASFLLMPYLYLTYPSRSEILSQVSVETSLSNFHQTGLDVSYGLVMPPLKTQIKPRSLKHLIVLSPEFVFDPAFPDLLLSLWLKMSVQSRVLDATLALTQYRLEHGGYPASFSDLVPGYLSNQPTGHQRDEPLQFKQADDGIIVYSAGLDGEDDGGSQTVMSNSLGKLKHGYDVVYFRPITGLYFDE